MDHAETTGWRHATTPIWIGRAMSGLFVLFMLGASVTPKFFMPEVSHPMMEQLGWPTEYTLMIGAIELAGVILYVLPRTAVLGAVLLMALLGGAMATQIRVENPLFSHGLFSVYLGLFMWGGLWLRDERLRSIFPLRGD
ncbi:MAG: DoxX family protein [Tabrizicola sp.]|nr:DoxX family protein [Tabrizicola sp.]